MLAKVLSSREKVAELGWMKGSDGFLVDATGARFTIEVATSAGGKNEQEAAVYVDSLRRTGFDAVQYITPVAQINDNEARATRGGLGLRGGAEEYRN